MERKHEDIIRRIKTKSSAPFGRKAIETDAEESEWDCWRQRWLAMALKRLIQSGLVPLRE